MAISVKKRRWLAPTRALCFARDAALGIRATVTAIVNRFEAGRTLSRFDERMLADIGLTRGDVDSAFVEPIWRDPTRRLAVIAVERRTAALQARKRKKAAKEKPPVHELMH